VKQAAHHGTHRDRLVFRRVDCIGQLRILLTYTLTYTLTYLLSFYLYVDGCFFVSLFIDLVQGALLESGKHILGILRVS